MDCKLVSLNMIRKTPVGPKGLPGVFGNSTISRKDCPILVSVSYQAETKTVIENPAVRLGVAFPFKQRTPNLLHGCITAEDCHAASGPQ
jgi:hypothetical protein